jgi:quinol---cytochrome-c reductase cytochrome b subunit
VSSNGDERRGRNALEFVDQRLGASPLLKTALDYIFPDHWSFLLGEMALYAFIFLIATGTYMALFFVPSTSETVYHGAYAPLQGFRVSEAFLSTVNLSTDVPAGLLVRQAHHWAALVFVAAIVVHLFRIFFTGAFRKPRELNYLIGVAMMGLAILEGFAGYSLPDDLLSGMGLAIAYGVVLSIPFVGGQLAALIWDGPFPGGAQFEPRLFILHVFILPAVLAVLIGTHLAIIMRQKHSQFRGPGRKELNVVGSPMWPGYALRSLGWMMAVFAVLVLLGGLVQINPIFQYGPFEPWLGTNGAQPDWYLGWLIGALRMMPNWEPHIAGHVIIGNPFFGGVLFPTVVFGVLMIWPWFEQRFMTRDTRRHDLLDRPRDNPARTAIGAGFFTWVFMVFAAGAADRLLVSVGFSYTGQIWFFRFATFIAPFVVGFIALRVARELRTTGRHPLRAWSGMRVRRTEAGGYAPVSVPTESHSADPRDEPVRERTEAMSGPTERG